MKKIFAISGIVVAIIVLLFVTSQQSKTYARTVEFEYSRTMEYKNEILAKPVLPVLSRADRQGNSRPPLPLRAAAVRNSEGFASASQISQPW